ncbi:hypothetical protein [Wenxinia saemankumensis]|uniref:Uncharacterized protein n=1 Tax=Wenxinia saemankumensis TaxID=1447782 RepID=A0A1M6CDS2_9RHOB|nr:hypothetical protein [Wenxinia saemankumensis]SHI59147.1 hypothetical protein SAMN05444417_1141 [Wenxinia saemankumensis]
MTHSPDCLAAGGAPADVRTDVERDSGTDAAAAPLQAAPARGPDWLLRYLDDLSRTARLSGHAGIAGDIEALIRRHGGALAGEEPRGAQVLAFGPR